MFLANTGLYILNPDVLDLIPEDKFFHMTELIKNATISGQNYMSNLGKGSEQLLRFLSIQGKN